MHPIPWGAGHCTPSCDSSGLSHPLGYSCGSGPHADRLRKDRGSSPGSRASAFQRCPPCGRPCQPPNGPATSVRFHGNRILSLSTPSVKSFGARHQRIHNVRAAVHHGCSRSMSRGNNAASRRFERPTSCITKRSRPMANPPCGGIPNRNVSRYPATASCVIPRASSARA